VKNDANAGLVDQYLSIIAPQAQIERPKLTVRSS